MATTTLQNAATTNGNGTAATGLTGPCTLAFSGTFDKAVVGVEVSVDSGTTYVPVEGEATKNAPGCITIDVKGTYNVRCPIRGASASTSITVVASYA